MKRINIHVVRDAEGKKNRTKAKNEKIMAMNIPKLIKSKNMCETKRSNMKGLDVWGNLNEY